MIYLKQNERVWCDVVAKKIINKSTFVVYMTLVLVGLLIGCDASEEVVIRVMVENEETKGLAYYAVLSNQKVETIDAFVSDDFQLYTASSGSFSSHMAKEGVFNQVSKIELEDVDGHRIINDKTMLDIFKAAEEIEHDIWSFQIIQSGDRYFVLVKLNVNWQSPCDLYEFDVVNKKLKLLHRFDGINFIGLSLEKKQ